MSSSDPLLDKILEVLMAYARRDFTPRLEISERRDELDAIATGINLLADELDGEVASRRELEAAHAELQATQAQLVVAEKFVAIGQLASGVTHELNNPASWVRLGLQHARRRLAEARALASEPAQLATLLGDVEASLADVHTGTERIWGVIGDLRTLSRVGPDETSELDLNEVIRQACQLARPAYQGVARLVLDLGELPPLHGNGRRLGQLITNLILNAAQAIDTGGIDHEIAISTRTDRDLVMIGVEDSGPGIPPELHERVFDPYFTTKPSDVGTGLGLALVRKIAQHHGGSVRVTTGTRMGARIEVTLPIRRDVVRAVEPGPSRAPAPAPRRARMLIIDDEPLLLRSLAEALRDDHEVVTALGGA
ncbi:MAG: Sensor protein, partial [Deltaproteobacteria bacterium]|nr:Sensor protein [Deltaproteobacteria bacterium]